MAVKADIGKLKGKILHLEKLIEYQDGSVVSREIVKGEKGGVTVFAFDAEEGLSEHTAPFDALLLVLDGEVKVTIGGKALMLTRGEAVIMPSGVPHAVRAVTRFKMALILIKA